MEYVGIYRNTASNTYCQYISTLSEITPIWTFPPSTIQVLWQFYIDSESFGGGFEVEFHGLLLLQMKRLQHIFFDFSQRNTNFHKIPQYKKFFIVLLCTFQV